MFCLCSPLLNTQIFEFPVFHVDESWRKACLLRCMPSCYIDTPACKQSHVVHTVYAYTQAWMHIQYAHHTCQLNWTAGTFGFLVPWQPIGSFCVLTSVSLKAHRPVDEALSGSACSWSASGWQLWRLKVYECRSLECGQLHDLGSVVCTAWFVLGGCRM